MRKGNDIRTFLFCTGRGGRIEATSHLQQIQTHTHTHKAHLIHTGEHVKHTIQSTLILRITGTLWKSDSRFHVFCWINRTALTSAACSHLYLLHLLTEGCCHMEICLSAPCVILCCHLDIKSWQ